MDPAELPGGKNSFFKRIIINRLNTGHFIVVTFLIILLPVVREWRTILMGERVTGVVVAQRNFDLNGEPVFKGGVLRCEIEFRKNDSVYHVLGPENLKYKLGKELPIILDPRRVDEFIIATPAGFYLQRRSIALIIVLVIWLALYLTIVQMPRVKSNRY